jgi:hypothetical protein
MSGPYDATDGFQYSSFGDLTPVLSIYQPYPYRVYPPYKIESPGVPHPLAGTLNEYGVIYSGSLAKYQQAAERTGHSMLDYEPNEDYPPFSSGTVTIASGQVTLSNPNVWPVVSQLVPGYLYVNNKRYPISGRTSNSVITISDTGVTIASPTAFEARSAFHRELDPLYENLARIAKSHQEYAYALTYYAELAHRNGAAIGIYEFITNTWRNILYAVHEVGHDFSDFERRLSQVVNLKCENGMSILDIVQSYGGNVYWNAYVPNVHQSNSDLKKRYRRAIRQLAASYRNVGITNNVPLFRQKTVEGSAVADDLFQGLIEDIQSDQPGNWAMWAPVGEVTQHYKDLLTGLGYN